ncbi:MAG: HEAT repeat domain-containing protein, partial [Phycisphaerales bacterium]
RRAKSLAILDLSSQSEISPDIGQAARKLIRVENPLIRAKAASLITRLVLPDAMLVLTDALQKETDPIAAEPMLAGVARWPNAQASESVMHWFLRDDTLFVAACDAVWSFEEQGLWDEPGDEELGALNHERILDRLRTMAGKGNGIPLSGMKVLAKLGTPGDLELLVTFLHSQDPNQQRWAAMALVETPRATELLIQAAEGDPSLFSSAAESLITHRATPEGLRRLATLPSPDQEIRTDATVRMGNAIDVDRLGEAVKLAQLEPDLAIALLNRLLGGDVELNARSAKGVLQLVELEMHQSRPNRGLAAVRVLDQIALDPGDRVQADRYHLASLLMLGKIEEAMGLGMDAEAWFEGLDWVEDPELRQRIGQTILQFSKDSLTQEQRDLIDQIAPKVESPNPTESSEQKTEPAAEPKAGPTP